jgi:predicted protein tyrosine phosphatase
MKEIYGNLYVGNENDYENTARKSDGWSIVHACKEPYHRQALGYTERAAPKTHPEYLIARRENRLILNLVDADNPAYIPKEIIDAALNFVHEQLKADKKVLVHCNQGMSRSPSIGMLYLLKYTDKLPSNSFEEIEAGFREIYPQYNPAAGVRGFMIANWKTYTSE